MMYLFNFQILSPFHTSLLNMFENAKNIPKTPPLRGEVDHHEDTNCVSYKNSVVTNTINSIPQVIEKPCLPKRQYEDSDGIQQPMSGMLYDYQYLDSPLWYSFSLTFFLMFLLGFICSLCSNCNILKCVYTVLLCIIYNSVCYLIY